MTTPQVVLKPHLFLKKLNTSKINIETHVIVLGEEFLLFPLLFPSLRVKLVQGTYCCWYLLQIIYKTF